MLTRQNVLDQTELIDMRVTEPARNTIEMDFYLNPESQPGDQNDVTISIQLRNTNPQHWILHAVHRNQYIHQTSDGAFSPTWGTKETGSSLPSHTYYTVHDDFETAFEKAIQIILDFFEHAANNTPPDELLNAAWNLAVKKKLETTKNTPDK